MPFFKRLTEKKTMDDRKCTYTDRISTSLFCEDEVMEEGSVGGDNVLVSASTSFTTVTLERDVHVTSDL